MGGVDSSWFYGYAYCISQLFLGVVMSVVRKSRRLFWIGFGLVVIGLVLFGWMIFSSASQAGKSFGDLLLVSDLGLLVLVWEYYPVLTVLGYVLAFSGVGCVLAYFRKH